MTRRYIIWRDNNAREEWLRRLVARPTLPDLALREFVPRQSASKALPGTLVP
jgi:hypothetical protein